MKIDNVKQNKKLSQYILTKTVKHFTCKPQLSCESYFHKNEKMPDIIIHAC